MILFNNEPYIIFFNLFSALIDILIISFIFYKVYNILSETKAVQVFKGLFFFIFLYFISKLLRLETFGWVLDQIGSVSVIAIIILFQSEVRKVLIKLGESNFMGTIIKKDPKTLTEILNAINQLSITETGALIVFERKTGLKNIVENATILDAKISTRLILSLFYNKNPLHDGAVLIKNDKIVAAGCFLPLSDSQSISPDFGTRHRAALGISEDTDAVVIVVSEETGRISCSYDEQLYTNYELDMLKKELSTLLDYEDETTEEAI